MKPAPQGRPGWTLIELLIVLTLMGLCAGLAVPSYQGLLQRSQRTQARMLLLQTAQGLERATGVQGSYPASLPATSGTLDAPAYQLSLVSDGMHYVLTATPWGAQAGDACGAFTLSDTGVRGVVNARLSASACWSP